MSSRLNSSHLPPRSPLSSFIISLPTQLFSLYNWKSSTLAHQRTLKPEILQAKLELDRTSSQDEFAKWAKLRRKLDKLIADLEKTS